MKRRYFISDAWDSGLSGLKKYYMVLLNFVKLQNYQEHSQKGIFYLMYLNTFACGSKRFAPELFKTPAFPNQ
jgi:hypothetical protein